MGDNCDSCDKKCDEHGTSSMLLGQHNERISNMEDVVVDMSNDFNNLEGRVTMFIWIIGLVFMLICSVSFYGVVQMNSFKDLYRADTVNSIQVMSTISSKVENLYEKMNAYDTEMRTIHEEIRTDRRLQQERDLQRERDLRKRAEFDNIGRNEE